MEETDTQVRIVREDIASFASAQQPAEPTQPSAIASTPDETADKLTWSGEISALKWMTFYSKVLARFITGGGIKLIVQMEISPDKGISK